MRNDGLDVTLSSNSSHVMDGAVCYPSNLASFFGIIRAPLYTTENPPTDSHCIDFGFVGWASTCDVVRCNAMCFVGLLYGSGRAWALTLPWDVLSTTYSRLLCVE